MSRNGAVSYQDFTDSLVRPSESLRAGEILARWAARLLEVGDYSRLQRTQLHEFSRSSRQDAVDRSAFGIILELAPLASLNPATFGVELIRSEIIGRGTYRLPCPDDAHDWEEESNRSANVAQRRHRERRTRSTLLDLVDTMRVQELSSQIVSAAEAADFRGR